MGLRVLDLGSYSQFLILCAHISPECSHFYLMKLLRGANGMMPRKGLEVWLAYISHLLGYNNMSEEKLCGCISSPMFK